MTEATLPERTIAHVAVPFAIVTLIWGSTWLVIRDQLGVVPSSWSVTYRFAVAAIAMFVWAALSRARFRLTGREHALAAALGLAQFVLNFNFVYRAEHHITSGLVAVIYALLIVPNAVLGRIFLKAEVSRAFLAGSAVAMGGIALLFHHEMSVVQARPGEVALGVGFALAGLLAASTANILQATAPARAVPMPSLLGWAMLWGIAMDAAFAFVTVGPPAFDWRWSYAAGILYLGLAGSALCFPLYFQIIRAIGPARAAYNGILVPVIAMALSTLFEGYVWSVEAGLGAVLVLTGLVIALAARRRR